MSASVSCAERMRGRMLAKQQSPDQVQMVGERDVPPMGGDPLLRLVQRDGTFWAPISGSCQVIRCRFR